MSNISLTYPSFSSGTTISSSQVNTNNSDITTWLNNRNTAVTTWDAISVLNATGTSLIVDNSSGGQRLVDFKTSGTTSFKIDNGGVCTITTLASATTGPALTLTEADTIDALVISPTNASFANNAIKVNTTRAANSAFNLVNLQSNGTLMFLVGGDGAVVVGSAAIATSATTGFLYIPSCNGTPIGTPVSFTGRVPMVYDTSVNKFYIYNGGWKGVTLS